MSISIENSMRMRIVEILKDDVVERLKLAQAVNLLIGTQQG